MKRGVYMKKYVFSIITVLILLFVLVGCGDRTSGGNKSGGSNTQNSGVSGVDSGTQITAEQAEQAALTHAGFTSEEVNFKRTELEFDDGIYKYEIEFYVGTTEYDYEIDANTGNIISFDKDID